MKTLWNRYSYAIVLLILWCVVALVFSIQSDAFRHDQYATVTVSQGDSLWKIAENYSDEKSLSKVDFVHWVKIHNQIDEDHIFPGEKIMIPVSSKSQPSNEFASAADK